MIDTKIKPAKDLGTFYLKVELEDGRGWIDTWETGGRWYDMRHDHAKIDAGWIKPTYRTRQEVLDSMLWMYLNGNYNCDCNKTLFYSRAYDIEIDEENIGCGDTMVLKRLTAVLPGGKEKIIYTSN